MFSQNTSGAPMPPPAPAAPAWTPQPQQQPAFRGGAEASPFPRKTTIRVGVLLDANVDTFSLSYLSQGARGGRRAALALRTQVNAVAIKRASSAEGGAFLPHDVQLLVVVFLDGEELRRKLDGQGVDWKAFAEGFNSSGLATSMLDVGSRVGASDEAIKGHLPFLFSSVDLLLIGSTREGRFGGDLLRLDSSTMSTKVLLVRTGAECAEEVEDLGLEEVQLGEGLFAQPGEIEAASSLSAATSHVPQQPQQAPTTPSTSPSSSSAADQNPKPSNQPVPPPAAQTPHVQQQQKSKGAESNRGKTRGGKRGGRGGGNQQGGQGRASHTATTGPPQQNSATSSTPNVAASSTPSSWAQVAIDNIEARKQTTSCATRSSSTSAATFATAPLTPPRSPDTTSCATPAKASGHIKQQRKQSNEKKTNSATSGTTSSPASTPPKPAPPETTVADSSTAIPGPASSASSTQPDIEVELKAAAAGDDSELPCDEKPTPSGPNFAPLLALLYAHASKGRRRILRTTVANELKKKSKGLFTSFGDYLDAAKAEGLVETGEGSGFGTEWVALPAGLQDEDEQEDSTTIGRAWTAVTRKGGSGTQKKGAVASTQPAKTRAELIQSARDRLLTPFGKVANSSFALPAPPSASPSPPSASPSPPPPSPGSDFAILLSFLGTSDRWLVAFVHWRLKKSYPDVARNFANVVKAAEKQGLVVVGRAVRAAQDWIAVPGAVGGRLRGRRIT